MRKLFEEEMTLDEIKNMLRKLKKRDESNCMTIFIGVVLLVSIVALVIYKCHKSGLCCFGNDCYDDDFEEDDVVDDDDFEDEE